MTFYPINHELTKIESGKYHLVVHTDCENDITPGYKLDFVFHIAYFKDQVKRYWASQPFGALPLYWYRKGDRSLKPLVESICAATYCLINTHNPGYYKDWQFRVNSGGFYSARFTCLDWTYSAHKNPRDNVNDQWLVRAMREGATIQAESSLIWNAVIDVQNHIQQFVTLGEFKK